MFMLYHFPIKVTGPTAPELKKFKFVVFRLISSLIYIIYLHPPFERDV